MVLNSKSMACLKLTIIFIIVATFDMSGARKLRPQQVKSKYGAGSNCVDIRYDGNGLIDVIKELAICSKVEPITRYDVIPFALLLLDRSESYRMRGKRHHRNLKTSRTVPRIVMYNYLKMCMQMWDGGLAGLKSFVERLTTCSSALFKIRQAFRLALNTILMNESDFQERQVQLPGGTKIWPRTERMQTVGVQAARAPSGTIRIRKQTAIVLSMG